MATKEEVIKMVSDYIGEDKGDNAILLMETVTDYVSDSKIEELEKEVETLKQEKTEVENTWREKYMKRFTDFTPNTTDDKKDVVDEGGNPSEDDIEPPSFEDIAKEF